MFTKKIGIDLGTSNSIVFLYKKGIVLREPSVVAVTLSENRILAVGQEAKDMIGRTPDTIQVYRPMRDGVIADYRVTQAMLKYFIDKASGALSFFKPDILVGVPAGITSTERRAVIEAGRAAGAKNVFLAKEPLLAAIGAGIPINSCSGHLVIDIGGGTAGIAVISLGGIVTSHSIRVAGDRLDEAISDYVKDRYNLAVGTQTAEEIKMKIGSAIAEKDERTLEVRGRDMVSGLPRVIEVSSNRVAEAVTEPLKEMVQAIKIVLRKTPPELSADIMDKGMVLAGGCSKLRNLDVLIAQETGVPCFKADEPVLCVAKGTGVVLENLDVYKKTLMSKR